jgi:hypothetical protein
MHPPNRNFVQLLERWKKAMMGPFVCIFLAVGEHILGVQFSRAWFVVIVEAGVIWQLVSELKGRPESTARPELYLHYVNSYKNDLSNSGFFLRVEGERKAANVEVSSEETVGSNHVRLGMRWFNPGHPIGKDAVPVKAECVYYKDGIPGLYHSRMGDQIYTFFDKKRDDPRELVVTLNYTDVSGHVCPAKRFRIHQDIPHLTDGKISCEPEKIQPAS